MQKFVITTENTADLPRSYYEQNKVPYMFLPCTMDGQVYVKENELPYKEFYERIRQGSMPVTSQVNSEDAKKEWIPLLEEGYEILHLAFSSGLSGTYNSCRLAAAELLEEHPEYKVVVIDTLCASVGQGLMVDMAVEMKKAGKTLDEIAAWVEENKLNLVHLVAVDDLNHLYRGGRVSRTSAVLGSMINIKPIIHVDDNGCLNPIAKVRGRKRSLTTIVDMMEKQVQNYPGGKSKVFISHSDCEEDALFVKSQVEERLEGYQVSIINPIGATIGAHTGPGTIALVFMGNQR